MDKKMNKIAVATIIRAVNMISPFQWNYARRRISRVNTMKCGFAG